MPVVRYVIFTGGALLALLLLADWYLPRPPLHAAGADAAHPLIRIHSENKWPAAVNIDTTMPIVAALPPEGGSDAAPMKDAIPPKSSPVRQEDAVVTPPRSTKAAERSRHRVRQPSHVAVRESRRRIAAYQFSDGWEWPQARW